MSLIGFIAFIVVSGYLMSKASEIWFLEEQQRSFKEALESIENHVFEKGPDWLALGPLHYFNLFLNRYLGESLFSKRSFRLISLLSVCLVIATIWLTDLHQNRNSFLKSSPWRLYERSLESTKELLEKESIIEEERSNYSSEIRKRIRKKELTFLSLDSFGWKLAYTIGFFIFSLFITTLMSSISCAITRQILRELVFAKGIFTLLGGVVLNFLLVFSLASFCMLAFFILTMPGFWAVLVEIVFILPRLGTYLSLLTYFGSTILSWFLLDNWIKIISTVPLFPCIILVLALLLCSLSYVLKRPLHFTILRLLKRSQEWKGGPIAFSVAIFTSFTMLLGILSEFVF